MEKISLSHFFEGVLPHFLFLLILIPGMLALFEMNSTESGSFWGLASKTWFIIGMLIAIIHQVLVWLVWRLQMCFHTFTKLFGKLDLLVWAVIFLPFLVLRPIAVLALGLSDYASLGWPQYVSWMIAVILIVPSIYTLRFVFKHFGIMRAIGGDHFRSEYQSMPFVREGVFMYTDNAMYSIAFLGLWSIAFLTNSVLALIMASFQHAYIWVHMYCTEEPDIKVLYRET